MDSLNEFGQVCALMIQNSCVPFIAFFPDGRIMMCNPAFRTLTGYSAAELEKLQIPEAFIPQEWIPVVDETKDRLHCDGRPRRFECEIARRDGPRVPVEIFAHEECDERSEVLFYYAFANDISAQKSVEEQLRRSEEKYRTVFDSANDGIILQEARTGDIVDLNRASWQMYGYTRDEYLKLRAEDFSSGQPPYTREKALAHISRAAAGEPQLFEWHARQKSGRLFWVEVNLKRISIGNTDRLLAVVRDITERRHAEEDAREARTQAELYLDLMGHDINNLNQIGLGYLELAMEGLDGRAKALLEKPYEVLNSSSRLIDNVRKIQKLKEGKPPLKAVDVASVLESVQAQYADTPGKAGSIHLLLSGDCRVMADDFIVDVFSNLVGNAIKHSTAPPAVTINMSPKRTDGKDWCRVSVEDNGPGIPDALKESVFQRIEKSRLKPNGRGLGLYLVKLLVGNYHGEIWVEDRVPGDQSKGCRFVVMLPAAGGSGHRVL